mmetsp:Transcript_1959/g.7539  ORF Transcript_1959/g.7539 Transcript_1959/m.7539 type:complete len:213 (-) Transcript_1959:1252-1890(-)
MANVANKKCITLPSASMKLFEVRPANATSAETTTTSALIWFVRFRRGSAATPGEPQCLYNTKPCTPIVNVSNTKPRIILPVPNCTHCARARFAAVNKKREKSWAFSKSLKSEFVPSMLASLAVPYRSSRNDQSKAANGLPAFAAYRVKYRHTCAAVTCVAARYRSSSQPSPAPRFKTSRACAISQNRRRTVPKFPNGMGTPRSKDTVGAKSI